MPSNLTTPVEPTSLAEESYYTPYIIDISTLRKRLYYHNYGRKWTQVFVIFLTFLCSVSLGMTLGWGSPDHFSNTKTTKDTFSPWVVSIVPFGCFIGTIVSSYIQKHTGPKKTILIQAPVYILIWWLMLVEKDHLKLFARFWLGVFGISLHLCGSRLLRDCLHYRLYKFFEEFNKTAVLLGIFIASIAKHSHNQLTLLTICATQPLIVFIGCCFMPESPVFLYNKDVNKSRKALIWYRGPDNIYMEMMIMRRNWEKSRLDESIYHLLFTDVIMKTLGILLGLVLLQGTCGYYIFTLYSVQFWNEHIIFSDVEDMLMVSGLSILSRTLCGIIHGLTDWNVKPNYMLSSCFVTICLGALSYYYYLVTIVPFYRWVPYVIVFALFLSFDYGLNFYPIILVKRYMPYELVNVAVMMTHCIYWFCAFVNLLTYGLLQPYIHSTWTFTIYAAIQFVGLMFIGAFVIEAKGASLMQIQVAIGGNPVGTRGQSSQWVTGFNDYV